MTTTTQYSSFYQSAARFISLEDVGATRLTDCTTAIETALASLNASGGGVLYIPPGVWYWNRNSYTTANIVSNITVLGAGPCSELQQTADYVANTGTLFVTDSGVSNVHFENFKVTKGEAIQLTNASYATIKNVSIDGSAGLASTVRSGVRFSSGGRIKFQGVDIVNTVNPISFTGTRPTSIVADPTCMFGAVGYNDGSASGITVTMHAPGGKLKMPNGQTTITVTNNLVLASSIIVGQFIGGASTPDKYFRIVPADGSFTVNFGSSSANDLYIAFQIVG